ncbi:sex peptide receptor-like [Pecten maximus]|uniref:sex peptide receptor-like n=1 Tax=Pecten maximus TaxID=6579 RepID=UPI0014581DA4|nr:sex peptide receptor-like [Pecten maximus]
MNGTRNTTDNSTILEADPIPLNSLFPVLFQTNNPFVIAVYKYMLPLFAIVIIFCNILTIGIFWKIELKKTTHMLLLGICACDMLANISLGTISGYVFYFEDYRDYLPYRICEIYTFLYNFLPVFFKYTSTYLILGLAIQRFICVVYPFVAKQICTKRHILIYMLFTFLCSGAYLAFQIHSHTYHIIETSSFYIKNRTMSACSIVVSNFTLWYIHPVFYIFLPLVILICITPAILKTLQRSRTLKTSSTSSVHNSLRSLSIITLWVVLTFVLCEIPVLIYVCATFACLEYKLCSFLLSPSWLVYTHYTILITSFGQLLNFVIYIVYNKHFRQTFRDIITGCRCMRKNRFTPKNVLRVTNIELLSSSYNASSS